MEPSVSLSGFPVYNKNTFSIASIGRKKSPENVIDISKVLNREEQTSQIKLRAFDLGGSGLKTGLFCFDKKTNTMNRIESQVQLGKCSDDEDVDVWIRSYINLDEEIETGCLFGFSLAGLDKLRSTPLESSNMSTLFKIPEDKIRCIDDGAAHLIASLNEIGPTLPEGPIWNFSIGTGVGFGFTDYDHNVRNVYDFHVLFGCWPWDTIEPRTGSDVWLACGSKYGFDELITKKGGSADNSVFYEFGERWKSYLQSSVLEFCQSSSKEWAIPAAIVFTGGHIELYGTRLIDTLKDLQLEIPIFTGPQNAGLLGAAWNVVASPLNDPPLTKAVLNDDINAIETLLANHGKINERDRFGYTPLMSAVKAKNIKTVRVLLQYEARIDEPDFSLETPLMLATKINEIEIVELLKSYRADVGIKNVWGQNAAYFVGKNKNHENIVNG